MRKGDAVSFVPYRTSVQSVHTDLDVQTGHAQLLHRVEARQLWRRHSCMHIIFSTEHWRENNCRFIAVLLQHLATMPSGLLAFFAFPHPRRQLHVQSLLIAVIAGDPFCACQLFLHNKTCLEDRVWRHVIEAGIASIDPVQPLRPVVPQLVEVSLHLLCQLFIRIEVIQKHSNLGQVSLFIW